MNQMQHNLPNILGLNKKGIEEKIKKFFPNFTGLMGVNGMGEMFEIFASLANRAMPTLENIAPIGSPGPHGVIELNGMFTIFKVREHLATYADPGWYENPPGTQAEAIPLQLDKKPCNWMQSSP